MSTMMAVGSVYIARKIFRGESEKGPYEVIQLKNPGPRQPMIGISVTNVPSGIREDGAFRVVSIKSVRAANTQLRSGEWVTGGKITVRAEVIPTNPADALPAVDPNELKPPVEYPELPKGMEDWFSD